MQRKVNISMYHDMKRHETNYLEKGTCKYSENSLPDFPRFPKRVDHLNQRETEAGRVRDSFSGGNLLVSNDRCGTIDPGDVMD